MEGEIQGEMIQKLMFRPQMLLNLILTPSPHFLKICFILSNLFFSLDVWYLEYSQYDLIWGSVWYIIQPTSQNL